MAAWVNSDAVDDAVHPRFLWGPHRERHLEKRILELGPPVFNPEDRDHTKIAALAEQAITEVARLVQGVSLRSLGAARREIREEASVKALLTKIDQLVTKVGKL